MLGRSRGLVMAASVCMLAALVACSDRRQPNTTTSPPATGAVGKAPAPGTDLAKDGYFTDAGGTATRFRIQIHRIQRLRDSSVLLFSVTLLDTEERSNLSEFGSDKIDSTFSGFHLVDTVGRRYYSTLRQGDDQGDAFGSDHDGVTFDQGVPYEARVYYPAIPASARHMTVISPGTPSEFTGVPVVDGGAAPAAPTAAASSPTAGQPAVLPGTEPSGDVWHGGVQDLVDTVETADRTTRTGAGQQTEALRADVLFAFDSAQLTAKAQGTLADVATEIKNNADPEKPITVVGHTDGKGTAEYNQSLSERRSRAVTDTLRQSLGTQPFTLTASGKGATEPVAQETKPDGSDNPAGRALNRRVEVTFARKSGGTPASGGLEDSASGVAPAGPRTGDGNPVAERTATVPPTFGSSENDHLRLRLYPFYRDGSFLVAVFDLTNVGGKTLASLPWNAAYFEGFDRTGDTFGTFSASDPRTGRVFRAVQIGAGSIEYLDGTVWMTEPNLPGRTYMYLSAPPPGTTSITFDAGPFAKIDGVPVE
jgi:outer membrane protein OmpA-like peptidoglycan-associated protein